MRRLSRAEWEVLLQGLSDPSPGSVSMPVQLYILALKALNNGLIINCYWEVIRYIRYPYLTNWEERQRPALDLPGTSRDEISGLPPSPRGSCTPLWSRRLQSITWRM